MSLQKVLIFGEWRTSNSIGTFRAENPATMEPLADEYPISSWADCEAALAAASQAAERLRSLPPDQIAAFLERFAERIDSQKEALVELAHIETALPKSPRLADVELPRTTGQLRQAAAAARDGSWMTPIIDSKTNIRSCRAAIGPVCVFGPNNFPFAFGSISGGDFAAAIAAGNPVIAKANSSHPGTTRLFAEIAQQAASDSNFPAGSVQLIYRTSHLDGERLVSDRRVGATGYTGSRSAGLRLKQAADAVGIPIYLELSSVNPVVILPGALRQRGPALVDEFSSSCLMGAGQFCTNPGLIVLLADSHSESFIAAAADKFKSAAVGTLLSKNVLSSLKASLKVLADAGAQLVAAGGASGRGYSHPNTLLRLSGESFLNSPELFQTEAFGNASLIVTATSLSEMCQVIDHLEGNLTGCIYSDSQGSDDPLYSQVGPALRRRVGRLLNDKMPTGVAVSPAMNHGGPFPATGHPGFTAVGLPAAIQRFTVLHCYDNVRQDRLPACCQDRNPNGRMWRQIDGVWSQRDLAAT